MPKTQVIYSFMGVFAGPSPSNNYHFINKSGILNNDWQSVGTGYGLVFPINRVIGVDYSYGIPRKEIAFLGNLGPVSRPALESVQVNLNLSYYMMGLINEKRLGLLCNIPSGNSINGPMIYNTGRVSPISGFYSRDTGRSTETALGWPLITREPRNLFVAVSKDFPELNNRSSGTVLSNLYKNTEIDVYGFGDCYMTSYSCGASATTLPTVSVSYVCNNVEMYSSGTDCLIPSINPINYLNNSGIKFSIPNNFQGDGIPTVLTPFDITIDIKQRSNGSTNLIDAIFDFRDIKIQQFDFNIPMTRNPLYGIGSKFPFDRVLSSPIISNLTFSLLPGDNRAGSLASLIKRDENYDISIKLNYKNKSMFTGVGVQFDFLGSRYNNTTSNSSIRERMTNELSFSNQIDPLDIINGFFITGYLGIMNYPFDSVNRRYQPLY
jgi:hypothetical protein